MIPNTGSWGKYTFVNRMAALNGIYQVISVELFDEALQRGVDFNKLLYSPAGLSKDDWQTDYPTYKGQDVYWLQPTDSTATSIPVPLGALMGWPDLDVKRYYNLSMVVTVGLYPDADRLSYLSSHVNDIVSSVTGQKSNVFWTASKSGAQYMTQSDYDKLEQTRQTNAQRLIPLSVQVAQRDKTIDDLKSQIAYLEQALIDATSNK